ncbi:uncharacterized protein LOC133905949 [Phragmites australis]|uniref:uncharacterized protein LOC133905949 n=1 Tax=Phragmites australis TaxID=29695 RepID=UPI002D76725F|nr:uncharacterized protein LOC133905949 [Phragmites australis]
MPLGQIELPVTFGEPDNFCIEKLTFDVVNFETAYNVILGHPMLGSFITVVHYVYQVLKIPGQKHQSVTKIKDSKLVSLTNASRSAVTTEGENNDGAKDRKAGGGIKALTLDPSEPAKTVKIEVDLDPK